MGAWGADIFDNDEAFDLVDELEENNDFAAIERALTAVLECHDYLDAPVAEAGLAAADIVARLRGNFGKEQETVDKWVKSQTLVPNTQTIAQAQAVVDRVSTEPSELLELWSESDSADWLAALDALKKRLSA